MTTRKASQLFKSSRPTDQSMTYFVRNSPRYRSGFFDGKTRIVSSLNHAYNLIAAKFPNLQEATIHYRSYRQVYQCYSDFSTTSKWQAPDFANHREGAYDGEMMYPLRKLHVAGLASALAERDKGHVQTYLDHCCVWNAKGQEVYCWQVCLRFASLTRGGELTIIADYQVPRHNAGCDCCREDDLSIHTNILHELCASCQRQLNMVRSTASPMVRGSFRPVYRVCTGRGRSSLNRAILMCLIPRAPHPNLHLDGCPHAIYPSTLMISLRSLVASPGTGVLLKSFWHYASIDAA